MRGGKEVREGRRDGGEACQSLSDTEFFMKEKSISKSC